MCVIACKHFKDLGWVGVKNRDRNYKPVIGVRQSFRRGVERLYIIDEKTKYTEGLNEHGIAIISSATNVIKDEVEGVSVTRNQTVGNFASPDGKIIRTALFEKTVAGALKVCIDGELNGHTLIFSRDECILLESTHPIVNVTEDGTIERGDFKHDTLELKPGDLVVRTNHGVLIKAGYDKDDPDQHMKDGYKSSISRMKQVEKDLAKVVDAESMLNAISSINPKGDPQLSPLRMSKARGKKILVTTGQIMCIPGNLTLYYRPIWCKLNINFSKIDSHKSKTYLQIMNSKQFQKNIISFKEFIEQ